VRTTHVISYKTYFKQDYASIMISHELSVNTTLGLAIIFLLSLALFLHQRRPRAPQDQQIDVSESSEDVQQRQNDWWTTHIKEGASWDFEPTSHSQFDTSNYSDDDVYDEDCDIDIDPELDGDFKSRAAQSVSDDWLATKGIGNSLVNHGSMQVKGTHIVREEEIARDRIYSKYKEY
jgi:hypothetical protein